MPYLYGFIVTEPLEYNFNNNIQDNIIPDLLPNTSELELLVYKIEQQQDQQNSVKLSTIYTTPISKRAASFIISSTFPTLFPIGRADFDLL